MASRYFSAKDGSYILWPTEKTNRCLICDINLIFVEKHVVRVILPRKYKTGCKYRTMIYCPKCFEEAYDLYRPPNFYAYWIIHSQNKTYYSYIVVNGTVNGEFMMFTAPAVMDSV